ncbi:hypothetical protein GJ496_009387 [Pomphorhynchus laevis]|nr:hypothetical protein GJ496_009387 [Pomphorhynchus laevis]
MNVQVLKNGYSYFNEIDLSTHADGSISFVTCENFKMIVDTGGAWNQDWLLRTIDCNSITHLICTHGHSDHCGNINIFNNLQFCLIGYDCNIGDQFYSNRLSSGEPLTIPENDELLILPTPGHVDEHVSVLIKKCTFGNETEISVLIAGDLFEREHDEDVWPLVSRNHVMQRFVRKSIIYEYNPDYIIPGHGKPFKIHK